MLHSSSTHLFPGFNKKYLKKLDEIFDVWNLTFYKSASVSSHNLSCAVSCPNIFVLNKNETVLPAAFTASSCEKCTEVIPRFGDELGFYRCITLALSFGTFLLPPLSCLSPHFLPSPEKYRRDVSTLHFGNGVVSEKEAIVKKRGGMFWHWDMQTSKRNLQ